jgi:hypothetical protein
MAKNKTLDQLLLLFSAVLFIVGLLWLIGFLENRRVPESTGFFLVANLIVLLGLTWNGVAWFSRTPRFWVFQMSWILVHTVVAVAWAYSGYWVELCVLALPLECYLHYRVGKSRVPHFSCFWEKWEKTTHDSELERFNHQRFRGSTSRKIG